MPGIFLCNVTFLGDDREPQDLEVFEVGLLSPDDGLRDDPSLMVPNTCCHMHRELQ